MIEAKYRFETASCPEMKQKILPSLFCFSLMLPFGYEPGLLRSQLQKGVGIFECDEFVVFSNSTVVLSEWGTQRVLTLPIPGDLSVKYGGKWNTALNTDIFISVWNAVSLLGRYQYHDWSVKVDPDAVFFPDRLREMLLRKPMSGIPSNRLDTMHAECGLCKLDKADDESCMHHIQSLQANGKSCTEALELAAQEPPKSCGCNCGRLACNVSATAMYLNNCRYGLHGPIEVLSREAVATYIANLNSCESIRREPFGEDKYLRRCLDKLGVQKVDEFTLLEEQNCGQLPVVCTDPAVTFHPFKGEKGYFDCWSRAKSLGEWPPVEWS